MPNFFTDPRMDMPFIRTWDSSKEHCAKVAIRRNEEIKRLKSELLALQSRNKEAMELLEAAVVEIKERECNSIQEGIVCPHWDEVKHCNGCKFKWQHADLYEALKAQSTAPTKNTDGEE